MRRTFVCSRTPLAASLLALTLAGPAIAQTDQTQTDQTQTDQTETGEGEGATAQQAGEAATGQSGAATTQTQAGDTDGQPGQTDEAGDDTATAGQAGAAGQAGQGMAGGTLPPQIERTMQQLQGQLTPEQMEAVRAMMMQMADVPEVDPQGFGTAAQIGQAQQQAQPGETQPGQPGDAQQAQRDPGAGSMALDLESFAQDVYERGFRQGYIRGATDARGRMMGEMQRMRRAQMGDGGARSGSGSAQPAPPTAGAQPPASFRQQDGGSIVILPPGMSPEQFLQRLQQQ